MLPKQGNMRCWPLALCLTIQPINGRVMNERTLAVSVPGGELRSEEHTSEL